MRRRLDLGFSVVLLSVLPELERLELERLRASELERLRASELSELERLRASELERLRTSEPAPPVLLPEPGRASNPAVLLERPHAELPPALVALLRPDLTPGPDHRGKRRRRWPREPAGQPEKSQRQRRRDARRHGRC